MAGTAAEFPTGPKATCEETERTVLAMSDDVGLAIGLGAHDALEAQATKIDGLVVAANDELGDGVADGGRLPSAARWL
jgi:hypothetical protein